MSRAFKGDASRSKYHEVMAKLLPTEITPSARQLLYHLAYRHNTDKGYSFPGETELVHVLGVTKGTIRRCIRELRILGLIKQISAGYRNHRAEYLVTVSHLSDYTLPNKRVSVETPITEPKGYPLGTNRVAIDDLMGITTAPKGYPLRHPITTLTTVNNNQQDKDLFNLLMEAIPKVKHFSPNDELLILLAELEHKGTMLKTFIDDMRRTNWNLIEYPKALVISKLRDLQTRPPVFSVDFMPKWCGHCDEHGRTLSEPVELPNGDGATTMSCPVCNPYMVNRSNSY